MSDWSPAMQAWLDEVMSRSKPLTVFQLDAIKSEFRKVKIETPTAA